MVARGKAFFHFSTSNVVDCTLRDGGYRNDWNFSLETAQEVINANRAAGVKYVELGFRFLNNQASLGAFAFTPDGVIESLELDPSATYMVMCNVADFESIESSDIPTKLKEVFPQVGMASPLGAVRLALTISNLELSVTIAKTLHGLGLDVFANLMQASEVSEEEVQDFANSFSSGWCSGLYLADSFGSMLPHEVSQRISLLRSIWDGLLGFHAHDNLGLATLNSLSALSAGADLIDATIMGMGRGAGNLRLEEVLIHAQINEDSELQDLGPLLKLVSGEFSRMKSSFGWGYSPVLLATGRLGVHPNFAQELTESLDVDYSQAIAAIQVIAEQENKRFDKDRLQDAINAFSDTAVGQSTPLVHSKRVVLLGPGPIEQDVLDRLVYLKNSNQLQILALNDSHLSVNEHVDFRFVVNPVTLVKTLNRVGPVSNNIVAPASTLANSGRLVATQELKGLCDMGFAISRDKFSLEDNVVFAPSPIALNYALAWLKAFDISDLFVAGFVGYADLGYRHRETISAFKNFQANNPCVVSAFTKNGYGIDTISAFGPLAR